MSWFFRISSLRLNDFSEDNNTSINGEGLGDCRPARNDLPTSVLLELQNAQATFNIAPSTAGEMSIDPQGYEIYKLVKSQLDKSYCCIEIFRDFGIVTHCSVILPEVRYSRFWSMAELFLSSSED